MTPWALHLVLPVILNQIVTAGKWQVKTGSLKILDELVVCTANQMAKAMPDIDTKADVKKATQASLTKACALVSNKDIKKIIPALISALINTVEEVPKFIQLLGAATFVSEVDAPTLATNKQGINSIIFTGPCSSKEVDMVKKTFGNKNLSDKQERQTSISKELSKEDKLEEKIYISNSEEPEVNRKAS
ncbi:hypothetical protein BY996DRAFT_6420350 [Phakopsora pachyrhizi]|nr:hypothetical protein BY996DRAFT_6420350 [Phakopsora pachyrhizi]